MAKVFLKRTILILFILLLAPILSAQNDLHEKLGEIEFVGLKKTKETYLKKLLQTKINQPLNINLISTDLQNLKNLTSIAEVKYKLDTLDQHIKLIFSVEERVTTLPILNFGGIKGNIWFTVGVMDNNFRGYGDLALTFYQNNHGRHSGQIYFKKPRVFNSDWGFSFLLNKWASDEPVFFEQGTVQYLYDNNSAGLSLIRNFGLHHQIELGETYFVEKFKQAAQQELDNPPGPDSFTIGKLLTRLEYKQNFLNYDYFYIEGFESLFTYQNVYNTLDDSWFNSLQYRGKLFLRPCEKANIAMRLILAVSTNSPSPFAPFVADSHENIRGIGNKIDRGTAQAILNLESRFTLFHKNYWSSQMIAFSDVGSWRTPGGELKEIFEANKIRHFMGVGIRFNYQKIFGATLRIDYGIDIYNINQKGFVVGFGQYF